MIPVQPEAQSPILAFTHILLIRVEASTAGPWHTHPEGRQERDLTLRLRLEEVFKGEASGLGQDVTVHVKQFSSGSPRNPAAQGAWAAKSIDPGAEHVAFSRCPGQTRPEALLSDACCDHLEQPELTVSDLRIARDSGFDAGAPERLLQGALAAPAQVGHLLPSYLVEAFGPVVMADLAPFGLLMRLLLERRLSDLATTQLVRATFDAYDRAPSRAPGALPVLVRVFFRLLARPNAMTMRAIIANTYLPALIGLQPTGARHSADELFRAQDGERAAARKTVAEMPEGKALAHWLDAPAKP